MIDEHKALFTDDILAETARRFALDTASIKELDGFENMVYETNHNGVPYILRFTHSSHRTVNEVHAELHWLDYLAGNNVSVCKPLRSINNALIEVIDSPTDNAHLIAVVFEKAKGGIVTRENATEAMTFNRGKLLGQMHTLTKDYTPLSGKVRRLQWYEENDSTIYDQYLQAHDTVIGERFAELIATLKAIPIDGNSYGLIHQDAHRGNIFFDGDTPTLFDFDDCGYDFFVADLAIVLFYAVLNLPDTYDRAQYASDFFGLLLEGYRSEHTLDNRWLELVPTILKRREMVLYVAIHRGFDIDNLDEWGQRYIREHRQTIINRTPVLDLNWKSFRLS